MLVEAVTFGSLLSYGPSVLMALAIVALYFSVKSFRELLELKLDQLIASIKDVKDNVTLAVSGGLVTTFTKA